MPAQFDTLMVVDQLTRDPQGGKRLYDGAHQVMIDHNHAALDPIHFVFAATVDDYAPQRVKTLLVRYGVHRGVVQKAVHHARPVEHRRSIGSNGDSIAFVNDHTRQLFSDLARRRAWYLDHRTENPFDGSRDTWSWYVTPIQLALEGDYHSIRSLLSYAGVD